MRADLKRPHSYNFLKNGHKMSSPDMDTENYTHKKISILNVKTKTKFVLKNLKKNPHIKDVLEIGCATGYSSNLLYEAGYNIRGIDANESAVKIAQEKYPHIKFDGIFAENFCEGKYDAIILLDTIEHLKDYKKVLKNIQKMLKPKGILIVTTDNIKYCNYRYEYDTHEFSYDELKTVFPGCKIYGFSLHCIYTKPITFLFGPYYAVRFRYFFNFIAKHFPDKCDLFWVVVQSE